MDKIHFADLVFIPGEFSFLRCSIITRHRPSCRVATKISELRKFVNHFSSAPTLTTLGTEELRLLEWKRAESQHRIHDRFYWDLLWRLVSLRKIFASTGEMLYSEHAIVAPYKVINRVMFRVRIMRKPRLGLLVGISDRWGK